MLTRKQLLKALGLSSVLAWAPLDRLLHWGSASDTAAAADFGVGNLYSGFLLLPNGTPLPAAVQPPRFGIPIVCGIEGGFTTAISQHFDTHTETQQAAKLPLYTFSTLPANLRPAGGDMIAYEWGEVFFASLAFQSYNAQSNTWDGGIELCAETDFPRPYPFWYDPAATSYDSTGWPEQVSFLPVPGLRVASGLGITGVRLGYVFYWITNDILYWLRVENYATRDQAQALAASLAPMR